MAPVQAPQHLFANVLARVHAACAAQLGAGADLSRVVVEPPRDPTHGDMATNAAMVLAKDASQKPRDLAEAIAAKLRADPLIDKVDVAGPGFINLTLKPHVWAEELRVILASGAAYGRGTLGQGEKINVEYVSANPTGPMHVGHGRGAVFGDALANLLAFAGYDVTREYYINDAGAQVDVLARSAFLRYREALGEAIGAIPDGLYPRRLPGAGRRHLGCRSRAETHHDDGVRMAAHRPRQIHRHDDGHDPRRSRRAQCPPRRILFRTLAKRGARPTRSPPPLRRCGKAARSMKAGCRRPKAAISRNGKTASRRCSARPPSATTSTGR